MELNHLDENGRARMVDVTEKKLTERVAVAQGKIIMKTDTLSLIVNEEMPKGDVLAVARVAGIMGSKKTYELIPMCHPILLTGCTVLFQVDKENSSIKIQATTKNTGKTGVEMEALTAVNVAALAIYDMCKAVDRGMIISDIRLISKVGGKSGKFLREGDEIWEK